jgi:GNAT superfamily N-acetyltransferase
MILPENISISTDKNLLDVAMIYDFLRQSYWATNRSLETIQTSIEHSFCFGLYDNGQQIGFARVISDCSVFAYIMDVFVLDNYRGQGLGKSLMQYILDESVLKNVRKWMLGTRDAHGLYRQLGFTDISSPEMWMQSIRS